MGFPCQAAFGGTCWIVGGGRMLPGPCLSITAVAAGQLDFGETLFPWPTRRWTGSGESEPSAEVELRIELRSNDGTAWLRYDIERATRLTGPQHHSVSMATTPCQFGGQRWWWICPATGARVSKLYLPNGGNRFL